MSSATGLSVMDVAVLDALDHVGATPDRYVKNKRVLDEAFQCHNIPPRPGYQVLCDLSRSWVVHLPLVDFHGNAGSPDFGPASPLYTESRLSPLGAAALAAERGETEATIRPHPHTGWGSFRGGGRIRRNDRGNGRCTVVPWWMPCAVRP